MTRIMIIDDEPLVRETLRTTIDWEIYDCEIVAEATDGAEAMEIYEKACPDIIITDIVMTFTNGLDFISAVKSVNSDVEIIILSGYDNFEYAQTALKHAVSAYLLKPIHNDTIIAEVQRCQEKIKKNKQAQAAILTQPGAHTNNFLFQLLQTEEFSKPQFDKLCEQYQVSLPSDQYSIAVFQVDKMRSSNINSAFIQLWNTINYHISTCKDYVLSTVFDNNLVVLYVYSPLSGTNDINTFLTSIQTYYKKSFEYTVTIGVSGVFKNLAIVKRAYQQALTAIAQKAVFKPNSIIKYLDISFHPEQAVIELNHDNIDEIVDCLKHSEPDKAVDIINTYFEKIAALKTFSVEAVKNDILELIITCIQKITKSSTTISLIFNRDFFPAMELQSMEFFSDIRDWTIDVIQKLGTYYDEYVPHNYSPTLNKALLYIRENYASKMTAEDVAKKLLISTRTLSRLFLSETGKSFSEHLAEYRIKAAIHMIENTPYKVVDIAALVGYNSIQNFYKAFKKITGHNPTHYKDDNTEEDI